MDETARDNMAMEEATVITLDDGEYVVIDTIRAKEKTFVYLTPIDEIAPRIKRLEYEDGVEYVVGLKDEAEFDEALALFSKKHSDLGQDVWKLLAGESGD